MRSLFVFLALFVLAVAGCEEPSLGGQDYPDYEGPVIQPMELPELCFPVYGDNFEMTDSCAGSSNDSFMFRG